MRNNALIIFTRVPIEGRTKTRLMPYLTGIQAAKLHAAMLKDIQERIDKVEADVFVFHTPEDIHGLLHEIFFRAKDFFLQEGNDLGERMNRACSKILNLGYQKIVLIGTDVPMITEREIARAYQKLDFSDVVFGPSEDGGYYLVGMKRKFPIIFEKQAYGEGKVLAQTRSRLHREGVSSSLVRTLFDIDERKDVEQYRMAAVKDKDIQRMATFCCLQNFLKVSVIVPIYNEESTILSLKEQLYKVKDQAEIIFVDGQSTDHTLQLLGDEFVVLQSKKGRAAQMNLGAKYSTGDILFFLHCDSILPEDFLQQIKEVAKTHLAGCFGIAFDTKSVLMKICQIISNHRIKDRKVMFGDQGIFIWRELFEEMGGYQELPIMEDYQFSLDLKERRVKLGIARKRIYTSDRRFPKSTMGKLKIMWKMNRLRKLYRDGASIEKIHRAYKDVR